MHYIEKGENKLQVKRDLSAVYFVDIRTTSQKIKLALFPYLTIQI